MTYALASFDLANAYGKQGELLVLDTVSHLRDGRGAVEVKRKSRADDVFFVEVFAFSYGKWVKSGLSVTLASVWAFVVADTEVTVFIPAERLRAAIRKAHGAGRKPVKNTTATQQTRGYLITFKEMLEGGA